MAHLRLQSARVLLIGATATALERELTDRSALARTVGAEIPLGWPPPLYERPAVQHNLERLTSAPEECGWWSWYVLVRRTGEQPLAIGVAGFKGPPENGAVEVGYSIVPAHQNRGYATETVRALMAWAYDHAEVQQIFAQTLPDGVASVRVLEKLGFAPTSSDDAALTRFVHRP